MTIRSAMSRRELLGLLPALALTPRAFAQGGAQQMAVRALNHATLSVTDVRRSQAFYQGLFGMPVQARQGSTVCLRIGTGPQFLALRAAEAGSMPGIHHFCMSVEAFDLERVMRVLAEHGVAVPDAAGGPAGAPMRARVRLRGPEAGGAKDGTPELYVAGPDGIEVQLQDTTYCGGAGALGNVCGVVEPSPSKGLLAVRDLNHVTMFTSDGTRSNAFYQELFGLRVQAYQAATPVLGVGPGAQFIMFAGRGAAAAPSTPRPARIDHVCVSLDGFDTGTIVKALESNGISPRASAPGSAEPLVWYITMRMPDRGGAPGGTPELYFTDPDGIAIQIQDTTYCGGAGPLGDVCS